MAEPSVPVRREPLIEISDPDRDRYARLRLVDGYDRHMLALARVMVVGAGALGNEVLKNLALLGGGHVLVIDLDTIEIHNLTRSILFREQDCGRPKALVTAERVRQINPDVDIRWRQADVIHDIGLGLFGQMDVVLGCLDNRAARLAVNRACWRMGVPWVDGALNVGDGSVRVFVPPQGACYECLMTHRDYELAQIRYACPPAALMDAVALTTPMSASIIGAMQVQEAVKLLGGTNTTGGWGVVYSGEPLRTTRIDYPRRSDCPVHDRDIRERSVPYGVDDLTVGQVLDLAADDLGPGAQMVLPDQLVTALYCPVCDETETVYQPYRAVVPHKLTCRECGTTRVFDVTDVLVASATAAELTLRQVGIAPYALVNVRAGRRRLALVLDGDHDRELAGWERKTHDAG